MADFETLHAAEADAREDAGGFPPVELPEEPEPAPEPEAEKELTEEEIKAAEEQAAKKAAKKERKKREPAKELSLKDLQKVRCFGQWHVLRKKKRALFLPFFSSSFRTFHTSLFPSACYLLLLLVAMLWLESAMLRRVCLGAVELLLCSLASNP